MQASAKKTRRLLQMAAAVGAVGTAMLIAACSKSDDKGNDSTDQDIGVSTLTPVANAAEAQTPVDAVPSSNGQDVYFIAYSARLEDDGVSVEKIPAIFKAVEGGTPVKLFEGAPLVAPFNITISADDKTLYIADSAARTSEDRLDGAVFTMLTGGGTPTVLAGTEGLAPAGVDLGADGVIITGRKDGHPGVFKTGFGGGNVSAVLVDGPFTDPSGVAVSAKGEIYVIDTGDTSAVQAGASVIHVRPDGTFEILKDNLSVGHPAGIALVQDETAVLVSAMDNATANDRVYRLDVGGGELKAFSNGIGEFAESAGLHRARNAEVFAWADSHANKTGTVYRLAK